MLIKGTRAEQLIKGLVILLVVTKLSEFAKLYVINFILDNAMRLGFIALLIVFQPELRRALEFIGRNKFSLRSYRDLNETEIKEVFDEVVSSVSYMSKRKIGALIAIERNTGLGDIADSGVMLDADISSELLTNIFMANTPLHDGAVLLRGNKIVSANCYLPLSDAHDISQELGTRHRAALGLSEVSDALIIIVSEETGAISVTLDGEIKRFLSGQTLKDILVREFKIEEEKKKFLNRFWEKIKNE
jgi:diadenylate cyclase